MSRGNLVWNLPTVRKRYINPKLLLLYTIHCSDGLSKFNSNFLFAVNDFVASKHAPLLDRIHQLCLTTDIAIRK